jgi:diadenosine tetraphosphate (Ap4A) HIT family hydrolase
MFELHEQLQKDTVVVGRFVLSLILLHRDSQYPWAILVPQRPEVTEIHHLDSNDRLRLIEESCQLAEVMVDLFAPRKMNVAALGNMVPQLHVHHIARFEKDAAWPHPVWGRVPPVPYLDTALAERLQRLRHALAGVDFQPAD